MTSDKHNLVLTNLELAKKIARQRKTKISTVSLDDLESAAYFGLVQAAEHYDKNKSDNFVQYAIFKIFGAIRDYLRELLWGPRKNPWKKKEQDFDQLSVQDHKEDNELFFKIISVLPINNQVAMKKYYVDCDKMSDIANVLGVNESRISQIITESKKLLKEKWAEFEGELYESAA